MTKYPMTNKPRAIADSSFVIRHSSFLQPSYRYCERLARREAGNFFHAFQVLPRAQRRAMCALYAFMRHTDDLADGPNPVETKRTALKQWRTDLYAAITGEDRHPL